MCDVGRGVDKSNAALALNETLLEKDRPGVENRCGAMGTAPDRT